MKSAADASNFCSLEKNGGHAVLTLSAQWRLANLRDLSAALAPALAALPAADKLKIDGSALTSFDTAAALLLQRMLRQHGVQPAALTLHGFSTSHERVYASVSTRLAASDAPPPAARQGLLVQLGMAAHAGIHRLAAHLSCLGMTIMALAALRRDPTAFRYREWLSQLHQTGVSAIPVVTLVMFLIGAVMAYLLGMQAAQYGANIYVVDGVTLGTVREFAPLLVATVVAGRSGASFTAQLGTMKLTEEIDAIRTLGMSAEQVLLLPRVLGLVVVLPLLVFIGSVAALAGAAMICNLMLDITPATFLERMHGSIALRHYFIGLFKAPVFAVVISVIGCSMGFTVSRDTRSIGLHTTSTVVQCIVAVVLLDAIFAIVFQELNW